MKPMAVRAPRDVLLGTAVQGALGVVHRGEANGRTKGRKEGKDGIRD